MRGKEAAKSSSQIESVQRIEPARLEDVPEAILNVVAELSAASAKLGQALHPHRPRPVGLGHREGRGLIALPNRCSWRSVSASVPRNV